MNRIPSLVVALGLAVASPFPATTAVAVTRDAPVQPTADAADAFMAGLAAYCGQAFAGRIIAKQPTPVGADPFDGKPLVMHVRGCDEPSRELRVPFHVGQDRSRTWVITRTGQVLRLKHDHRHEDGSADAVTLYGGDSLPPGTAERQQFPVDAESVALFKAQRMEASLRNTWAMQLQPGKRFIYELSRPDGRLFQVEFDLTAPVPLPPAPWGSN